MRIWLTILLLTATLRCQASIGDVTGGEASADEGGIRLWVDGFGTNVGVFNVLFDWADGVNSTEQQDWNKVVVNGFDGNWNNPTPTGRAYVVADYFGYDTNATTIVRQWTNHITWLRRRPYPDEDMNDVFAANGKAAVKLFLSDPIFAGCSNVTAYLTDAILCATNASGVI